MSMRLAGSGVTAGAGSPPGVGVTAGVGELPGEPRMSGVVGLSVITVVDAAICTLDAPPAAKDAVAEDAGPWAEAAAGLVLGLRGEAEAVGGFADATPVPDACVIADEDG